MCLWRIAARLLNVLIRARHTAAHCSDGMIYTENININTTQKAEKDEGISDKRLHYAPCPNSLR